ncbi:MAG: hypothetical protein UT26_C0041G0006 [Microgenomates group bacterium GW2011_GWC1_39_12]|nr:MAG: hypothetical protein UT26_C0041G0006 [Microgenomates group bacterium GW2011_GWC1_39_12]
MIDHGSPLWNYLSDQERILADDGAFLVADSAIHKDQDPTDYSYLVFPYAKLYEGFLKDVFRDLGIIVERDYRSNHFRIGKVLSPNLTRRLGKRSAYGQLRDRYGAELAEALWHAWREGRNLVFHYFPSDFRLLAKEQALACIQTLIQAMEICVARTHVQHR